MRGRNYIIMCIMIIFQATNVFAINYLQEADSAYLSGNFDVAIESYKKAIESGNVSSEVYYNLGNAYYKIDDLGNSVICYNRALKLEPTNEAAKNNLIILRSKIEDLNKSELKGKNGNVVADKPPFFERIYNSISKDVHADTWSIFGLITFLLLLSCIAIYVFIKDITIRKIGFFGGIIMVVATIILMVFSFMSANYYKSQNRVVITTFSVSLKSESKEASEDVSIPFHKGTEFKVLEKYEDVNNETWYKVRLNNDVAGWIKQNDVEVI